MTRKLPLLLLFAILLTSQILAQNKKIDSLKSIATAGDDTTKLNAYIKLSSIYSDIDIQKTQEYLKKTDSLQKITNQPKFKAHTLHNYGKYYFKTGSYEEALNAYREAMDLYQQLNQPLQVASSYNNIGLVYEKQGSYEKALENLIKALEIWEKKGAKTNLAKVYLNIGLIHYRNSSYQKAEEYYKKSLEIRKEINDKAGIALVFNNLAIIYYYMENYDNVRNYFEKAYQMYKELGNLRQQSMTLANLAEIYNIMGQHKKALEAYRECLAIDNKLNDQSSKAKTFIMISEVYKNRGYFEQAIRYLDSAYHIANKIEAKSEIRDIYLSLSQINKQKGDYETALEWHEKYMDMHDSIFNATKNKQIQELQTKYDTEKKEQKIELLNKEKKLQKLRIKKQQYFVVFISIIAIIVLTFAVIVVIQKKRLSRAHRKMAKQQKQITDSIEYASRIQNAILPAQEQIASVFSFEHFILLRPKEVVSGDFYFIDQKSNKKIIAAVDCTGHGVPGAFMSMLGYSFLSEIVNNSPAIRADEILNKLRDYIIKALRQKKEIGVAKDGMDISLCIIDEEKQTLEFAGAYQYMLFIRDNQLKRYKGDKMPIGIHYREQPSFNRNVINYKKGDSIYLFSDGYPDQFGGEKGKKFRLQNFQDMILTIHEDSMDYQKEVLEKTFNNWKSTYEQVDDILVIGFRL